MASALYLSPAPYTHSGNRSAPLRRDHLRRAHHTRLYASKPGSPAGSESENVVLRVAWYGSELLGIAASFFRPAAPTAPAEGVAADGGGLELVGREQVSQAIQEDFRRSYFVTGNLTPDAFEDDCEFADPAGSFRGLRRFKRNCSNFGSLLLKSNMKLTKWEDFEDKGVGHWRFSCVMSFPWRPILSGMSHGLYFSCTSKTASRIVFWSTLLHLLMVAPPRIMLLH